jgi:hypothetical protein
VGYWNYDSSQSLIALHLFLDDDDALEAVWKKAVFSAALTAADQFKSYEQLEKRLKMVLGQKSSRPRLDEEVEDEDNDRGSYTPDFSSRSQKSELPEDLSAQLSNLSSSKSDEDEDDALSYFQRLAEE